MKRVSLKGSFLKYISGTLFFCLFFTLCPISGETGVFFPHHVLAKTVKQKTEKTKKPEPEKKAVKDQKLKEPAEVSNDKQLAGSESADSDIYKYEKPTVDDESYAWIIIKTIIILGLMAAGFYFFFRFVTKKAGLQTIGENVVQVLSMVPLGQNKFIQIVDMAGKILVLGVTDANINLLMEIKDKDEINRIRLAGSRSVKGRNQGFQEVLLQKLGKILNRKERESAKYESHTVPDDDPEIERFEYLLQQKARLKKLGGMGNEE